jgi:4-hydroxy-2-oxoheptanedioate aldolase
MTPAASLVQKIRDREQAVGYWIVLDAPIATERLAGLGYDYVALDGQHGLLGYSGLLQGLMAVDAGAVGVIVPLVDDAEQAAAAVAAARYPPHGVRSYGPMRSALRIGPAPRDADAQTLVLAMIETPGGLDQVEAICATPGLDGVYVGPSDLCLAVGGERPGDPAVAEEFEEALRRVREAAAAAGVAAGIHTPDGATAARRLAEGYSFATISSDLTHLERSAADHLKSARV